MKSLRISFLIGNLALVSSQVFGQIVSDFNSNSADGWTAPVALGPGTINISATGGNPGGFISASDPFSAGPPPFWYFIAPAKFLGNRCPSYNKNLTFDLSQSNAGTDNTQSDVILVGGGLTLTYKITPAPAIFPAWSPYTVLLNESSGWKTLAGVAPTKDEFKTVLCNLTSLSIRGKYNASVSSSCGLDNVAMGELTVGARPVILSINPVIATPGATVTVAGSNFNSTITNNIVYFGAVKATVVTATPAQLTVKVPPGASLGRITVTNTATSLEAQSMQNFNPTFDNNLDYGGKVLACSMDLKFDINLDATAGKGYANAADLDGDGLTDLLAVENNFQKFSVFRNLGLTGDINASSFAAKVSFDLGAGYNSKGANVIADLDGDGKPDVAVGTATTANGFIAIFRNTSTPGNISFDPVQYVLATYPDGTLHAADIDGDGRMDLLTAYNNGCGGSNSYFAIFQNMSLPGDIEFCAFVDFDFNTLCQSNNISTGDLNGDGKLDIAVTSGFDNFFYIFQNTSTPGTLSLATPFQMDSPGLSYNVVMTDFDADGKLDLAWKSDSPNDIYVKKNTHTAGALSAASFSADIVLPSPLGSAGTMTVADINGDGKPDIVANDDTNLGIIQNISTPGILTVASFSSGVIYQGLSPASFPTTPVIADFDGDSKPDVVFGTANTTPALISIYRNECFPAPTIGALSSLTGNPGIPFAINGNLMFTANQTPTLLFGAAIATAGTTSNTLVATSVPLGAAYSRVGVTLHGLSDFSDLPFSTTFPTSPINAATFATSVDFPMTNNTGAMAVGDFDKDGKIDIIAEDATLLKIFRNTLSAAGANIDNTTYTVLSTTYSNSARVASGDFDGDGWVDLITNGFVNRNNSGTQSDPISFESNVNTVAGGVNRFATNHDFNHDGKMDVAFTDNGNLVRVTENTSRKGPFTSFPFATFQPLISLTPGGQVLGIDAGDFDGDGFDDLVYAVSSGTTINVHLNTKLQGTITNAQFAVAFPITVGSAPYEVVAVDLDQDGKLDLAVSNYSSTFITVLRNTSTTGSLSFVRQDVPALSFGFSIRAADLNGDGKPELVTIHTPTATTGSFAVFPNTSSSGTISFGTRIDYTLPNAPAGLALADVNLDQKMDIIIPRNGDFLSIFQNNLAIAQITVTKQPLDNIVCAGVTAVFAASATGTTNITYQWQFTPTSAGPFTNISNGGGYSGATTDSLSVNTTGSFGVGRYRCSIGGDFANAVLTTDEGLFINSPPTAPTVNGASTCKPASVVLTASGSTNGNYRWFTAPTGGTAITGEVNSTYATPVINATTIYFVSIVNVSGCESVRTAVTATLGGPGCNQPPVIAPATESTGIGGAAALDLTSLLSDPDGNLDLSTLTIIQQPSSGAVATIDVNHVLKVDYQGLSFSGTDSLTIQVCDLAGACVQKEIQIQVVGKVTVYNALSANGDGKNEKFILEFIDVLPDTKKNQVTIYNRWGDEVFAISDYNNTTRAFAGVSSDGKPLPSGTYFYKVLFPSGTKTLTGYLELKR